MHSTVNLDIKLVPSHNAQSHQSLTMDLAEYLLTKNGVHPEQFTLRRDILSHQSSAIPKSPAHYFNCKD
ncbi:hypothetical protein VTN77DRAFT_2634 [Rasamsonia byssochlamydoides]|uniref:uncharacterized protein n=1 Tax=Rasamsonia byssochlamydoides TaxID=89139 RepID=UPI003742DBE6